MNTHSQTVAERLAGGAPRGLGCANAVATKATRSGNTLDALIAALRDPRPVVTIRAANALKKVQQARPELLPPHGRVILQAAVACEDLRTRWNLVVVLADLPLRGRDRALAVALFFEALGSDSGFLRAFALTGLSNFALEDQALRRRVKPILDKALEDTSAAVRARARKLLGTLDGKGSKARMV